MSIITLYNCKNSAILTAKDCSECSLQTMILSSREQNTLNYINTIRLNGSQPFNVRVLHTHFENVHVPLNLVNSNFMCKKSKMYVLSVMYGAFTFFFFGLIRNYKIMKTLAFNEQRPN